MNNSSKQREILKRLDILTAQYAEKLPSRLKEIRRSLDKLEDADSDHGDVLIEIHRLVHSLAGTSGTYGYVRVSKYLRGLETYIDELTNSSSVSLGEDNINRIEEELAAIEIAIDEVQV